MSIIEEKNLALLPKAFFLFEGGQGDQKNYRMRIQQNSKKNSRMRRIEPPPPWKNTESTPEYFNIIYM